jgi:beta-glucanase (GH16 family)
VKLLQRTSIVLAICFAAFASVSSAAFATSQLVYSDEFNGPLDSATWANATPWNTQYTLQELEWYDPAACTFGSGSMKLTSDRRSMNGFDYTSAIATSLRREKFSYGYFEIRAKLPKGPGIWPAFWLTNDSTLEIDGLEMLGDRPTRIYQTLHENKHMIYSVYHDGPDYSAGFHTYGIDWQPGYVKWYIDGVLTNTYTAPMPSDPLYICLNTAVGGAWPGSPTSETTFPQCYDIDYVRVYDTKPPVDAITARADSYSTPAGVTLNVNPSGVLSNDSDSLGHPLSAGLVTQPAHGTLGLNADGSFVYVPTSGYSGPDSFTYACSDGHTSARTAVVALTVLAPTPTTATKPNVKKKTRSTYTVSGTARVGATLSLLTPVVASSTETTKTAPVVLTVQVQRWRNGKWRAYGTRTIYNPSATAYKTTIKLLPGLYRVRSLVSGGGGTPAKSPWSQSIRRR